MRVPAAAGWWAWQGSIPVSSRYTFGIAGQRFMEALVGDGVILGARCEPCSRVYVPATLFCEKCFSELDETVAVGPEGEVVSFTVVHRDLDGATLDAPQIAAAVRLDGATSVFVHRGLGEAAGWSIGARARVVLADDRKGSILDIAGVEIIG